MKCWEGEARKISSSFYSSCSRLWRSFRTVKRNFTVKTGHMMARNIIWSENPLLHILTPSSPWDETETGKWLKWRVKVLRSDGLLMVRELSKIFIRTNECVIRCLYVFICMYVCRVSSWYVWVSLKDLQWSKLECS